MINFRAIAILKEIAKFMRIRTRYIHYIYMIVAMHLYELIVSSLKFYTRYTVYNSVYSMLFTTSLNRAVIPASLNPTVIQTVFIHWISDTELERQRNVYLPYSRTLCILWACAADRKHEKCAKIKCKMREKSNRKKEEERTAISWPLSSLPRPFHQREEERAETWLGQDFFPAG